MGWKYRVGTAALAAGIAFAIAPSMAVSANSLSVLKDVGAAQTSPVQKTWGWHRTCRRGLNGWHKHVKGIGRVQCTTRKCRNGKCYWY